MTFQYASDLHLEFPENYDYLNKFPIQPKADVLILAGDIVTFSQLEKRMDFFNYVSDNFEQVYWIPGNHEYYYGDIARCAGPHQEQIKNNVELVNNITIKATDYDLIFSTMWSHISPPNERQIFDGMSDFYVIRNNGQVFRPTDYNRLHQESLDFIQREISNENGQQKIVVTHHVPTLMNYPSRFLGSILNEAFAVELTEMIEKYNPLYWIYGHHHQNTSPFKIGETIMLTNQLGYVRSGEHTKFDSAKLLDILD
ncbi:metallophosphoesterase [Pedobacter miscanthi]|uniref:metallophosphoesterase n=1 Tax=Pedobacter miscanthi TaxID=2259170 RepID=UPI002930FC11|nr:metallophosphoesterase [Pedobacter miscanthi]